jgi:hypothetical protein
METVILRLETANLVLSYLGTRPYEEVATIIGVICGDVELLNGKKEGGKEDGDKGTDRGE